MSESFSPCEHDYWVLFQDLQSKLLTLQGSIVDLNDSLQTLSSIEAALISLNTSNGLVNTSLGSLSQIKSGIDTLNSKVTSSIYGSTGAQKFVTASASIPAATAVLLVPANANRKGFTVYNNSTNSLYVLAENPAAGVGGSNLIDFCASNAGPTSLIKWLGPVVYTGAIYGLRNAGSGSVTVWEFT